MSFENKGFPNDLNSKYNNLRAEALKYDEGENFGFSPTQLSNLANIVKNDNKLKTIDESSKGIVKGGGISTKETPAELPEFKVEAKKPTSNKMKYFYYIIAVILIILIYKQFKK